MLGQAQRKIQAILACLLLVASQWLGILTGCSTSAQPALATSIGDTVEVISTGEYAAKTDYSDGITRHSDSTNGATLICLEQGITGGSCTAHVKELLGASTSCFDHENKGYVSVTWTERAVTEAALIFDYAYSNGFDEEKAYVIAQCYTWAYARAGLSLDGMAGWLGYVPSEYRGLCQSVQAHVRSKSTSWTGHGILYSKDNQTQQLARFWIEPTTGKIELRKSSSDQKTSQGNDCYSLEGAEYGLYSDEACTTLERTLVCDASGSASADGIRYGTYYLREDKAAQGYALDEEIRRVEVPAGGTIEIDVSDVPQTCAVDVAVRKVDAESGEASPKGAGAMVGAEFRIDYYAGFFDLENLPQSPSQTYTVTTGDDGAASLDRDLPLGTVVVRETKAPKGYVLDPTPRLVKIASSGTKAKVDTYNAPTVGDRPIRGDLSFVKADEDTQRRMAGVAFKLTSQTTGEAHVLITDENGCFDTADLPHSQETNAADAALAADGKTVDSSKLKACSVWFGGSEPDDAYGALPYDTYLLEELRCEANAGHRLASATVTVSKDGKNYHLGTFDDKAPAIATALTYSGDDKVCPAADEVQLVDTVSYEGLERGHEYRLYGELHDFDGNGADMGVVSTAEDSFTPVLSASEQQVTFTVDTSTLGGHRLVAYERLYDGDDLLGEHADATDEAQTVRVPKISTELVDDAGHEADATTGSVSLTDTVSYVGLEPGRTYTINGTLHLKGDDGEDAGPALDDEGDAIEATTQFTAEKASGQVDIAFEFCGLSLAGKDIVAFEELSKNQVTYAVHADIRDVSQTVSFPALATTARGGETGDHDIACADGQKVIDKVEIKNLRADSEYEVRGTLHLVGEDGSDEGTVSKSSLTFNAETEDMIAELEFSLDASELSGRKLVVFEELYAQGKRIGSHADLSDEDQSIHVPAIATTLADASGAKQAVIGGETMMLDLTDTVSYRNLIVGKEYLLKGELHLKAADGSDAGVLTATDGTAVVSEATFTPDTTDGEAQVRFLFDAAKLSGKTVVAFEKLYADSVELAAHADITDEGQAFFLQEKPPVEEPPAGKVPTTGDAALPIFACSVLGGLLAFCSWAIVRAGSINEAE